MKPFITLIVSFLVNFATLGVLENDARRAQAAPAGEVLVTQLPGPADLPALADVVDRTSRAGTL